MSTLSFEKLSHKKKSSIFHINNSFDLVFICGGPTTQINDIKTLEEYILMNLSLKYIGGGKNPLLTLKLNESFLTKFPDKIKLFIRDFIKFYETLEQTIIQKQCFIVGVVVNSVFFEKLTLKKILKKLITFNYFFEISRLFNKKYFILFYIFYICCLKTNPLI